MNKNSEEQMNKYFFPFLISLAALFFGLNCNAIEPFSSKCIGDTAQRYEYSTYNSLGARWTKDNWWLKDNVRYDGGKFLYLNNGKIQATVIDDDGVVIRAIDKDRYNIRIYTFDIKLGHLLISHQQKSLTRTYPFVMTRSTGLNCKVSYLSEPE